MVEEDLVLEKPIEINLKKLKLKKKLKKYKIPIVLGLIGLIFIIIGGYLLLNSNKSNSSVEIIQADKISTVEQKKITIDVSGAVFKPGVYQLKEGSRLQDGLVMAGGLSDEADRDWVEKNLNLAIKLTDGNKVYIPRVGEANDESNQGLGQVAGMATGLININTASMADLDTLSGVGEKTAEKIIAGRPYSKIEDLVDKKIVGKAVFEKIKEKISI